jgi:hypothetical protein
MVFAPCYLRGLDVSQHGAIEVCVLVLTDFAAFGADFGGFILGATRGLGFGLGGSAEEFLHDLGTRGGWLVVVGEGTRSLRLGRWTRLVDKKLLAL